MLRQRLVVERQVVGRFSPTVPQTVIDGDPINPRMHIARNAQLANVLENRDENLLRHVLSVARVRDIAPDESLHAPTVSIDELRKSVLVALLHPSDEFRIVYRFFDCHRISFPLDCLLDCCNDFIAATIGTAGAKMVHVSRRNSLEWRDSCSISLIRRKYVTLP